MNAFAADSLHHVNLHPFIWDGLTPAYFGKGEILEINILKVNADDGSIILDIPSKSIYVDILGFHGFTTTNPYRELRSGFHYYRDTVNQILLYQW